MRSSAVLASGLLASTVSAAFDAASSKNVAVYWGQGAYQIPLTTLCEDESVDIVNLAFVNSFPTEIGFLPASNFANACADEYFTYPNGTKSGLLSNCPGIGPGIKKCQDNGKKVMLSVGGGWPTNYYLPSEPVAKYFAEFLWGAFGPQTDKWVADKKPRPFGDAAVDGFDLDLEAYMEPAPMDGYLYKHYDIFVNHLKSLGNVLISGAPQCVLPDARLAHAISASSFDFVFLQFYNTPQCSSRAGYNGLANLATSTFTFDAWVDWLKANSANKGVKMYLGLPAGPAGAPWDAPSYLTPTEANKLVSHYSAQHPDIFGGVMLWEATVSANNKICDKPYVSWIKSILDGKFTDEVCPSTTSSVVSSTVSASSTSSSVFATPTATSPNGLCGPDTGYTCKGYHYGKFPDIYFAQVITMANNRPRDRVILQSIRHWHLSSIFLNFGTC
ncbi:glycoside hydrolase [Polyplosphaeria fusca]|uniref:chitinase n=1 Tax=Polyplosphaeria fusca TaxID=682080 RepID=A0A9P4R7X1_9PLEO|nr:glycoside hydrolase [Polyplosphaeria fusca]